MCAWAVAVLLRREGLHSSNLSKWRRQRQAGQMASQGRKKHGRKVDARAQEVAWVERENARSQARLERAELIIEAQEKLLVLLNQEIPEGPEPKRSGRWRAWVSRSA